MRVDGTKENLSVCVRVSNGSRPDRWNFRKEKRQGRGTRWGQKDLQYGISSGLTRVLERKEEEENRRGGRRKGARRKERKEEEKIERNDKVALRV